MKPSLKEFCQKFNISESEIVKKKCFSEFEQLRMIKKNWKNLEYIENPSEEVKIAAVKQDTDAIQCIENPSEAIQLAAVQNEPLAIQFIENPSEEVQLLAVENSNGPILNLLEQEIPFLKVGDELLL